MVHSTPPPMRTAMPRMKTTDTVARPVRTRAAPSANTIGQNDGGPATALAATASSSVYTSPSRVNDAITPIRAPEVARPNSATAPRSVGFTKTMYKIAAISDKPVRPKKYFEPGVIILTYFCTYTTNHTTENAAVRKYQ